MIQTDNQKERHTLPRWNSLEIAEKLGELDSGKVTSGVATAPLKFELNDLLDEWRIGKNLPLAIEIISAAKFSDASNDISEIVEYARKASEGLGEATPLLKELLFEENTKKSYRADAHQVCIERIKKSLIEYPRNPLLWSELSREYTILGQEKKSKKAIHVAHGLAPENRTVLRSIAKFYEHTGDLDQALFYLRKSARIKEDPWLLSSEIALSNTIGRSPKNIKRAQQIVLDESYHPLALSELASELGTMDFTAGNNKQGKRRLALAARQPHENAVAQMTWINKNACNVETILERIHSPECNFEAETRWFFDKQDWNKALAVAGLWQEYQPFSKEPAMVSSFIATDFLMDYQKAQETLVCGLKSNPNDYDLLNNYAYVLALENRLEEASEVLERAGKIASAADYIPLIATGGLLCYRSDDIEQGRLLYLKAIEAARRENNQDLFYRATLCMAREEKRCGFPIAEIMKTIGDPKYDGLKKQYETIIKNFGLAQ